MRFYVAWITSDGSIDTSECESREDAEETAMAIESDAVTAFGTTDEGKSFVYVVRGK